MVVGERVLVREDHPALLAGELLPSPSLLLLLEETGMARQVLTSRELVPRKT